MSMFAIERIPLVNEGKFYEFDVPAGRATEAGMLIDYIGWGNTPDGENFTRVMSDAQIEAAQGVWDECGDEPDYSYRHDDRGTYTRFTFWPHEHSRAIVDAVTSYLATTTKTTDLHFTVGGRPNMLSGRKIFFYDGPGDGARKVGSVFHRTDGWWQASN